MGLFFCKDDRSENGYTIGNKGDYILKKEDNYIRILNCDFTKYFDIKIINLQPKQKLIRNREEEIIEQNNKKRLLEKDRNYYKMIDQICYNFYSKIHYDIGEIIIYYPKYKLEKNNFVIYDYNYEIKFCKDIFPLIEIYDKNTQIIINVNITFIDNNLNYISYFKSFFII